MSGTSSLTVGKAFFQDLSSQSKTTNGVGSAYGDGSYITMSPYQSSVNDPDIVDKVVGKQATYPIENYNVPPYPLPYIPTPYPQFYPYPTRKF